jgi:putative intracellular protease/amidase
VHGRDSSPKARLSHQQNRHLWRPSKILTDAGHEVVVATPNGVTPNVDMMSLRPEMVGGIDAALELEAIIRSAEAMRRPLQLSDVRLEDYDAVYLPGGHGPMSDLAWDADCGRLLTAQLTSGNPLFIVCHAPAATLATRIHGVSPFRGYKVTGFSNEEEEAVGVAPMAPWLLETDLKEKVGVDYSRGPIWGPYIGRGPPVYAGVPVEADAPCRRHRSWSSRSALEPLARPCCGARQASPR